MRPPPTSRSRIIRTTTARRTSSAPTTSARRGRRSSTAFRRTISCTPCAKIRCKRGLLFAGTEHGIYVSFDDGAHWQSLALNLPDTQVSDLVIEGNDLVIATHGRSFYILDDITPLRQLTPAMLTSSAHLFKPPTAVRNVGQGRIRSSSSSPPRKSRSTFSTPRGRWSAPTPAARRTTPAADVVVAEDAARQRRRAEDAPADDDGGGGGRGAAAPTRTAQSRHQ